MPGFSRVLSANEIESLLAFLYEEKDRQLTAPESTKTPDGKVQYFNISGYTTWIDQSGNPALQPPWGTLHSLNLNTGEYEWEIPLGNDEKRNTEGPTDTGLEGKSGPVVTAGGLIFISGAEDKKFRALEKSSGKLLWETTLPAMANATACTFIAKGKQYVAISVGGTTENPSGSIMAFALPE